MTNIVRPFMSARDAHALGELAITRLKQLLRIDIDDDGEFADDELSSIEVQLGFAFEFGNDTQRAHLLSLVGSYLKNVLGESHEWIYDLERGTLEAFIGENFAADPHFSAEVIELADWHIERSEPSAVDIANRAVADDLARELLDRISEMNGADLANMLNSTLTESDDADDADEADDWADFVDKAGQFLDYFKQTSNDVTRMHWAMTRIIAMAVRGDSGDALHEYAEELGLIHFTEALYLIADAYKTEGQPRKAIAVLRENADAVYMFTPDEEESGPMPVDLMLAVALLNYSKEEMIDLYHELLLNESYVANYDMYGRDWHPDVMDWYEQLHGLVGDSEWGGAREELLASVSDERKKAILSHEESLRKFHRQILEVLGEEALASDLYGEDCTGSGPLMDAAHYTRYAETFAQKAKSRSEYHKIALALFYAITLCDEVVSVQECVTKIAAVHSRKHALLEELRLVGFDV
ncbi:MAG: hypothetical protein Q4B54_05705 [Coriobacteriales bacterium]|nr:hypothetical protein [Coriobacteriales bacterium]